MTSHPMGRMRLALAMLLGATASGTAQDSVMSRQMDPLVRLDASARYQVELILDSARQAGLPTPPIESKALEGISKRANGRVIVLRVREVFRSLRDARLALGRGVTTDELEAGAGALRVGVPASDLAQLARTRSQKALTVPLVVLADLINRGVPRETATQTIAQLFQRGAADDDFQGLWQGVQRDIVSGTDPGVALQNRAREIPVRTAPAPGNRPPEPSENQNR